MNGNGRIHEIITPIGNLKYSDIAISHKKLHVNDPKRNLKIFQKMLEEKEILSPREEFYYARELFYHKDYISSIANFKHFLSSKEGWIENNIEACLNLSKCYREIGNKKDSLSSLLQSFEYDIPRAEICYEIGTHFFSLGQYQKSIFWYQLATSCIKDEKSGGFIIQDCYDYLPFIQLCVCYDKLGNRDKAIYYNNKAGIIKPQDSTYLYNKNYFDSLI